MQISKINTNTSFNGLWRVVETKTRKRSKDSSCNYKFDTENYYYKFADESDERAQKEVSTHHNAHMSSVPLKITGAEFWTIRRKRILELPLTKEEQEKIKETDGLKIIAQLKEPNEK